MELTDCLVVDQQINQNFINLTGIRVAGEILHLHSRRNKKFFSQNFVEFSDGNLAKNFFEFQNFFFHVLR